MSEHISPWLGAYHDGELRGNRLRLVEVHLAACETCRAELEAMRSLSFLLKETSPEAEFIPTERFVANLVLSMPRVPHQARTRNALQMGWWLVPVGLLLAMLFVNITTSLSSIYTLAADTGLFDGALPWVQETTAQMDWFARTMSLFGNQLGSPGQAILSAVNEANVFIAQMVRPLIPQALLAAGYLGWMLTWWLRSQENHTTQTAHRSS